MPHDLIMRKRGDALHPVDGAGFEILSQVKSTGDVKVSITAARNIGYHRMFFAALNHVFKQQEAYTTQDAFLVAIKAALGHAETFEKDGKVFVIPKSISFASMDDVSFSQFFMRFEELVCTRILPTLPREEVRQFLEILDGNSGAIGQRKIA